MLTTINGKELWLETTGEGDPVVMVHGLSLIHISEPTRPY